MLLGLDSVKEEEIEMDMTNDKKHLPRWVLPVLILIGPPLVLWYILTYAWGMIMNIISFPFFVLGPGLILTRLFFLFRSHRRVEAKTWRTVLYGILLLLILFLGIISPYQVHRSTQRNAWERFETALPAGKLRTALGNPELGSQEKTSYHYYKTSVAVFDSHAHILLCDFSPEDYAAQKGRVEQQYTFRTEPLIGSPDLRGENTLLIEPYASIGNDEFRFLFPRDGANEYGDRYFKSCLILVTNDEAHEIGFIAFDDNDLDEAKDLTQFITDFCGWSVIRSSE